MSVADTDRLTEWEVALRIALSWVPDRHSARPGEALNQLLAALRSSREREALLEEALREARSAIGPWASLAPAARDIDAALSVVAGQPPAPVPAAKDER